MYHKVILAGHLGRDPEMRYTAEGNPVTNFNVATSRRWTGRDGEQREETIWWRISVWGKQAETANEYLFKGRPVLVEGRYGDRPADQRPTSLDGSGWPAPRFLRSSCPDRAFPRTRWRGGPRRGRWLCRRGRAYLRGRSAVL